SNLKRYDAYDRGKSQVYVGEYAAHERNRVNTLNTALAEAAYLTGLERNADLVRLASYAPLLAKEGRTQWRPDMIYFDNARIVRTANYYVQQLFSRHCGDEYLPSELTTDVKRFAASCVRDSASGDVIVKLVNASADVVSAEIDLGDLPIAGKATQWTLSGSSEAHNTFDSPDAVEPSSESVVVGKPIHSELPPHSLRVIRCQTH
ncbi:MAG: hypothetical protein KDA61_10260, partial [Planctomycetales bacterium]|nr:hypothetical protein [Planctomycetales bacterium]